MNSTGSDTGGEKRGGGAPPPGFLGGGGVGPGGDPDAAPVPAPSLHSSRPVVACGGRGLAQGAAPAGPEPTGAGERGHGTTRHASAAPWRLGSIRARSVRAPVGGN